MAPCASSYPRVSAKRAGTDSAEIARETLREGNVRLENTRASVHGFGNVAQFAIRLYQQMGGTVVCVSSWDQRDQKAYAFRKDRVDVDALLVITDRFGGIDKEQAALDAGIRRLEEALGRATTRLEGLAAPAGGR